MTSRIGGVDGNQTLTITAAGTGEFEDAVNTDTISAADNMDIEHTESASSGTANIAEWQTKFEGDGDAFFSLSGGVNTLADGETRFHTIEGAGFPGSSATLVFKIRGFTVNGTNLYIRVRVNSINGTTVLTTLVDEASANLTVSIGSAATGAFEDLVNSDTIADQSDYIFEFVAAGSSGTMTFNVVSVEMVLVGAAGGILAQII